MSTHRLEDYSRPKCLKQPSLAGDKGGAVLDTGGDGGEAHRRAEGGGAHGDAGGHAAPAGPRPPKVPGGPLLLQCTSPPPSEKYPFIRGVVLVTYLILLNPRPCDL